MTSVFGVASGIDYAKDLIGSAAEKTIGAVAKGIGDAVGDMLEILGTLWIRLDVPNVWTEDHGTSATVTLLHSKLAPVVGLLAVLGILIGGANLAVQQRGEPARDLVHGMILLALVTGCGVPAMALAVSGADAFAQSIVSGAGSGGFGRNVTGMLALSGPTIGPMLLILLGVIAFFVSLAQIALMVLRAGVLVLLAGFLPVVAAGTMTQAGRDRFKKYLAWVVALTIYKPIAAACYLAAFKLIGTDELSASGAGQILIGVTLMAAAVLALPALIRLLVPTATALRIGAGTGAATTAALVAVPAGARILAARGAGTVAASAASPRGASQRTPTPAPAAPPAPAPAPPKSNMNGGSNGS